MTESAYNHCVNQYADSVYRFVLKNIRNSADAEDVVQSAFQSLWEMRASVTENPKSLLFTIAYRKMIDLLRKSKKVTYHESMIDFEKEQEEANGDLKKILDKALNSLDEIKRALILLKDYEGYSYAEIGTITSLSESQVKVYLHRARLQLKAYIVKIENII